MVKLSLLPFAIVMLISPPVFGCDLEGFDEAPPSTETGTNGPTDKTHFEWGSDVDPYGNEPIRERSWHYVRNLHDQNLSLYWKKTGLLIPFDMPLSTGDCRSVRERNEKGAFEIDFDAPILTSNDGESNAVAYVVADGFASKESPKITGAEIRADYRTGDGERETAFTWLIVYYFPDDQFMELKVYTGEAGESMAFRPKSLGLTINKVNDQLSESGVEILESSSLDKMIKLDRLSEQAFKEIENDNFIRISTKEPLSLKFTEVSEIASEKTSILLFSPKGSLLLAKRLAFSMLSQSDD